MQTIKANNYSVFFNENGYQEITTLLEKNNYSSIFILCDENTHEYCVPTFLANLATTLSIEIIEIEPGESLKNIATCVEVCGQPTISSPRYWVESIVIRRLL